MSVTHPIVHLNGTSREELLRQLIDAGHAINNALDMLRAAAPHQRDYYVSPEPLAYQKARQEHEKRCAALALVQNELQQIAEAL